MAEEARERELAVEEEEHLEEQERRPLLCPLFSIATGKLHPCLREDCAWWGRWGENEECVVERLGDMIFFAMGEIVEELERLAKNVDNPTGILYKMEKLTERLSNKQEELAEMLRYKLERLAERLR